MPVTPPSSPPPPPLFFSFLSLSSDFSHPFATGGGSFSAGLLCTFSLFFCLCSLQGICPTLFNSPSLSLSCFYHYCSLLPPHPTLPKPPLHLFPALCREEQNLWRVSCALNLFLCLYMWVSIFCIFLSSLLLSVKTVEQARARYQWWDGEMKKIETERVSQDPQLVKHWLL